jgi:hypothetical protein
MTFFSTSAPNQACYLTEHLLKQMSQTFDWDGMGSLIISGSVRQFAKDNPNMCLVADVIKTTSAKPLLEIQVRRGIGKSQRTIFEKRIIFRPRIYLSLDF